MFIEITYFSHQTHKYTLTRRNTIFLTVGIYQIESMSLLFANRPEFSFMYTMEHFFWIQQFLQYEII